MQLVIQIPSGTTSFYHLRGLDGVRRHHRRANRATVPSLVTMCRCRYQASVMNHLKHKSKSRGTIRLGVRRFTGVRKERVAASRRDTGVREVKAMLSGENFSFRCCLRLQSRRDNNGNFGSNDSFAFVDTCSSLVRRLSSNSTITMTTTIYALSHRCTQPFMFRSSWGLCPAYAWPQDDPSTPEACVKPCSLKSSGANHTVSRRPHCPRR